MSREIMQQALSAFEEIMFTKNVGSSHIIAKNARYALREELAKPEQEPVAWMVRDQVDGCRYPSALKNPAGSIDGESQPLYTAPPRKEWVGLTDDEINDFDKKLRDNGDYCSLHFAWGISAKLKELNT